MNLRDVIKDVQGYQEIQKDIETLTRYGVDYTVRKSDFTQVINQLHPRRINLVVSEIITETRTAKTLRLVGADGPLPPFLAGQYLNLFVKIGGIRTSRPYSIASAPNQIGYYDVAVRRVMDGFVSNYLLDEVQVGDRLESSGPAGNFAHNPLFHGDKLVFLAGGSGITPFMSMIREVTDRGLARRIHLIYGCQALDDVIFGEELAQRARRHPNFTYDLVISNPPTRYQGRQGFITAELIRELVDDIPERMFSVCGPEAMYAFCLPELARLGIPPRRLRTEVMGPPQRITAAPGWPEGLKAEARFTVTLKGRGTIAARAGEPLMIALERAGIAIPALCRSGECSLCRTKLVSGTVYHPQGVRIRKSDRQFGYIHPCMAYPISDIEIMV